jgi:hypothetical protein
LHNALEDEPEGVALAKASMPRLGEAGAFVFPPRFVSLRESQKTNKNNDIQRISMNQNVPLLRFLQLEYFTEILDFCTDDVSIDGSRIAN